MSGGVVLDSSVWLQYILHEEGFEVLRPIIENPTWMAPEWIRIEAANAVSKKRSHSAVDRTAFISEIKDYSFTSLPSALWFDEATRLAVKYDDLTFYAAAYIACAKMKSARLLTADDEMNAIARRESIELLEL